MAMDITLVTSDITSPNVAALELTATASKFLDVAEVNRALEHILPKKLLPGGVSPNVALKRAMQEIARGDSERDVKTSGRKASAVYTVLRVDSDRIDREESDGRGVADAEVSARIDWSGEGDSYTVKVSPETHPAASYIRTLQREYSGKYSATYDLKPWFSQRVLPWLGAVSAPDAGGKYILPCKDNQESVEKLLEIRDAFKNLSAGGKFRIYAKGMVRGDSDAVDLIADAISDERERVCGALMKELSDPDKRQGKRRIATMTAQLHDLRDTYRKLCESFGMAHEDSLADIDEVERMLGVAELALENK